MDGYDKRATGSREIPARVGPYRVMEKLGDGGMGVVWLAEQVEPIQRLVTLKTVRPELSGPDMLQRFERERQNLARLSHPNIALILDAGNMGGGIPYLVMEYVNGVALHRYCLQQRASIPERLELVIEICEAVQHAHQKGVVHKDLKPDNVLVTRVHGSAHVKVIDFGISKLLRQDGRKDRSGIEAASLFGTPQYMSPEQRDARAFDVDTRSDVYSIGIMLYELLCAVVPAELMHRVESVPLDKSLLPSEQVKRSPIELAPSRRVQSDRRLAGMLSGDLDAIVFKAIAHQPLDRYQTPLALAEDLRRYLSHYPITLRKDDSLYVLGRIVRRHRFVFTFLIVAAAALSILLGLLSFQVRLAEKALQRAEDASRRHEALRELLVGSFRTAAPGSGYGYDMTAREVLHALVADIDKLETEVSADRPALLAEAARFFYDLSEFDVAERLARRALASVIGGEGKTRTVEEVHSMLVLAEILNYRGDYREADELLNRALRLLDDDQPRLHRLARVLLAELRNLEGRYDLAQLLAANVIGELESEALPSQKLLARAQFALAESMLNRGKWTHAIAAYRKALAASTVGHGRDAGVTHDIFTGLAYALGRIGEFRESEAMWRDELAYAERTYGPDNQRTVATLANLGNNLLGQQRWQDAGGYLDRAYESLLTLNGLEHQDTLTVLMNRAIAYMYTGRMSQAEDFLVQVIELRGRLLGEESVIVAYAQTALAEARLLQEDYSGALPVIERAERILQAQLGMHWQTGKARVRHGQSLLGTGDPYAAHERIRDGLELLRVTLPARHPTYSLLCDEVLATYAALDLAPPGDLAELLAADRNK